jgi:hypothetical protein
MENTIIFVNKRLINWKNSVFSLCVAEFYKLCRRQMLIEIWQTLNFEYE